jgi:hypothetical protein
LVGFLKNINYMHLSSFVSVRKASLTSLSERNSLLMELENEETCGMAESGSYGYIIQAKNRVT